MVSPVRRTTAVTVPRPAQQARTVKLRSCDATPDTRCVWELVPQAPIPSVPLLRETITSYPTTVVRFEVVTVKLSLPPYVSDPLNPLIRTSADTLRIRRGLALAVLRPHRPLPAQHGRAHQQQPRHRPQRHPPRRPRPHPFAPAATAITPGRSLGACRRHHAPTSGPPQRVQPDPGPTWATSPAAHRQCISRYREMPSMNNRACQRPPDSRHSDLGVQRGVDRSAPPDPRRP